MCPLYSLSPPSARERRPRRGACIARPPVSTACPKPEFPWYPHTVTNRCIRHYNTCGDSLSSRRYFSKHTVTLKTYRVSSKRASRQLGIAHRVLHPHRHGENLAHRGSRPGGLVLKGWQRATPAGVRPSRGVRRDARREVRRLLQRRVVNARREMQTARRGAGTVAASVGGLRLVAHHERRRRQQRVRRRLSASPEQVAPESGRQARRRLADRSTSLPGAKSSSLYSRDEKRR